MKKASVDNVYSAQCELDGAISDKNTGEREDVFVTPKMHRLLYKMGGISAGVKWQGRLEFLSK